jgi:hypothetical protein
MLDVGSNLGYFGLRTVTERPEVAVVSIEGDPVAAAQQAELARQHDASRLALLKGTLGAEAVETWARTCDVFQTTLLLAVLHWVDDPARVVAALSSMSARLVAEVPDPADSGACGQDKLDAWSDPVGWFSEVTGRPCRHLGRVERHTSSVRSHLVLVEGAVERRPTNPYWDCGWDHPDGRDYRVRAEGDAVELDIRGHRQEWTPGVNVLNLQRLGALVHPAAPWWTAAVGRELAAHPDHPDPFAYNQLWGVDGVTLVDFEPIAAHHSQSEAMAMLPSELSAWESGATVAGSVDVMRFAWLVRLRQSAPGRLVVGRLPARVRNWLWRAARSVMKRLPRASTT